MLLGHHGRTMFCQKKKKKKKAKRAKILCKVIENQKVREKKKKAN